MHQKGVAMSLGYEKAWVHLTATFFPDFGLLVDKM